MRQTREEFVELRTTLLQGERKGHLLSEAFRQVLVQMTELFEAQRQENLTREEALRFFLNSIEVRLMNRSQGASRDGETASPAEPVDGGRRGGRRRWFRSSR